MDSPETVERAKWLLAAYCIIELILSIDGMGVYWSAGAYARAI